MEKLIYRNELNQEIEFSAFSSYVLTNIQESTKNELITTKQSSRDGEIYASSSLGVRDIKIKASIIKGTNSTELAQRLVRVFNPKLKVKLHYSNQQTDKEIAVYLDELPTIRPNKGTIDITIDMVSLDPYWMNKPKTEFLALLSPKFHFPLVIPKSEGIVFGLRKSILETPITNIGDVATGFRVVFKAKGQVKNPHVENKLTGEKIKALVTMEKGDVVEIINTPQRKMILLNGKKAFKHLDRSNADFFNLEVGRNLIGYNADLNAVNLDVILYYSPQAQRGGR